MAVNNAVHLGSGDTSRDPSPAIWARMPVASVRAGAVSGVFLRDDFGSFNKTAATTEGNWGAELNYAQFGSATGTITAGTGTGGEAIFGATADNEGISIRTLSTPFKISRTNLRFAFECRIKTSLITDTKHDIFVGLLQDVALTATVPITAAGAIADTNLVGFFRPETARSVAGTGGAIMNTVYKADGVTAVNVQTDAVTLVADTYQKLGMLYEPSGDAAGTFTLAFYANGVRLSTIKQIPSAAGTDFPNDLGLGLCFAVLDATGSTPGTSTIDWWQACQLL
jgi:hypothetical protein